MKNDEFGAEDIEIESDEPSTASHDIDADIDNFAERAFDAIVIPDESTGVGRLDQQLSEQMTFPPPRPAESIPAVEFDAAAVAIEMDDLRTEVATLRVALEDAERRAADVARLTQQLAEAKAHRPSTPPPAPQAAKGVSSREYLDLRESLNRKDKELLDLRDAITAREKQSLDLNEKLLQRERVEADLQDKLEELDRKLNEATQQNEALVTDRENSHKRIDDLRARLERTEVKAKRFEDELDALARNHSAELVALRDDTEARIATLQTEHAQALADAAAKLTAELGAQSELHAIEKKRLEDEHAQALAQAAETHNAERAAIEVASAEALRERDEQHAATVRGLQASHASTLEAQAIDAENARVSAPATLRVELETEMEEKLAQAEERRIRSLAEAAGAEERALASLRAELEGTHASAIQAAAEAHAHELSVLGRKLAETESALVESTQALSDSREARAAVEASLEARIAELESTLASRTQAFEARIATAEGKIARDAELLERARKAMAIGLELLETQKSG